MKEKERKITKEGKEKEKGKKEQKKEQKKKTKIKRKKSKTNKNTEGDDTFFFSSHFLRNVLFFLEKQHENYFWPKGHFSVI